MVGPRVGVPKVPGVAGKDDRAVLGRDECMTGVRAGEAMLLGLPAAAAIPVAPRAPAPVAAVTVVSGVRGRGAGSAKGFCDADAALAKVPPER